MALPRNITIGRALWGIHALWASVLEAWQRRNSKEGQRPTLTDIEFDKLAHVAQLLWNSLHRRECVSFRSAYGSSNGVHGPGPSLRRTGRTGHIPMLRALNHIQSSLKELGPDIQVLDLEPYKLRGRTRFRVQPGSSVAYQASQLSGQLPRSWQGRDRDYLDQIKDLLSGLSKEEIRALGTHQTNANTISAIEYNVFIHLFNRLIAEADAIEALCSDDSVHTAASNLPTLESVIDEIGRKAERNRSAYESGWNKLVNAVDAGNSEVRAAIEDVFSKPHLLWDRKVREWLPIESVMREVLQYFCAARRAIEEKKVVEAHAVRAHDSVDCAWEEQRTSIQPLGVPFPDVPKSGEWNATFFADLRASTVRLFDKLPGVTEYRTKYDHVAARFRPMSDG